MHVFTCVYVCTCMFTGVCIRVCTGVCVCVYYACTWQDADGKDLALAVVIWQFSFPDEDNSPVLQVTSFSLLIACMYLFVCCMCKRHGTHVDVRGLFRDHFSPCGPGGLNSESQVWQQPLSHLPGPNSDLSLQP